MSDRKYVLFIATFDLCVFLPIFWALTTIADVRWPDAFVLAGLVTGTANMILAMINIARM